MHAILLQTRRVRWAIVVVSELAGFLAWHPHIGLSRGRDLVGRK
jgi:hypothetical protein